MTYESLIDYPSNSSRDTRADSGKVRASTASSPTAEIKRRGSAPYGCGAQEMAAKSQQEYLQHSFPLSFVPEVH